MCCRMLRMRQKDTPCSRCGVLLWSARTSLPPDLRVCHPCRRLQPAAYGPRLAAAPSVRETRACDHCGVDYTPHKLAKSRGGGVSMTCSRACGGKLRAIREGRAVVTPEQEAARKERVRLRLQGKCRTRRAQKLRAQVERYTTSEIAARDRYRCGLCRRKVPMDLTHPHPLSPTIDHVVPLADGGDDVKANVQLAHFRCNSSKGVRGTQQLALIG